MKTWKIPTKAEVVRDLREKFKHIPTRLPDGPLDAEERGLHIDRSGQLRLFDLELDGILKTLAEKGS